MAKVFGMAKEKVIFVAKGSHYENHYPVL